MLMFVKRAGLMLITAAVIAPMPAIAASVVFSGNSINANSPPVNDGSCPAAAPFRLRIQNGPGFATGTSNLGAFTFTQSHCTAVLGAGPFVDGVFAFSFEQGDVLEGTYTGGLTPSGVAGVINNSLNISLTGGNGRFAGATGEIGGVGTITIRPGQNALAELSLNGTLDLPAVPEPGTWAMMIAGFGFSGAAARRRRFVAQAA